MIRLVGLAARAGVFTVLGMLTGQQLFVLVLVLVMALLEFVLLCADAEVKTRLALEARPFHDLLEGVKWQNRRLGIQLFAKDDEQLRARFRWPVSLLPCKWLWRLDLWMYFW